MQYRRLDTALCPPPSPPDDPSQLVIHSDRGCQYRWKNKVKLTATGEDYLKLYNTERFTNTLGGLIIEEYRRKMAT